MDRFGIWDITVFRKHSVLVCGRSLLHVFVRHCPFKDFIQTDLSISIGIHHVKVFLLNFMIKDDFTNISCELLIQIFNNLSFTIQAFEIIFDLEYPKFVSDLNAFLQMQPNNFAVTTLMEIMAIKFWFKFIQKRVLAINDLQELENYPSKLRNQEM